jgi:O-antigen/teichoic acid export membrane protein
MMSTTLKNESQIAKFRKLIVIVSIVIPIAVAALFGIKVDGIDLSCLPPFYAGINGVTAILLIVATGLITTLISLVFEKSEFTLFIAALFAFSCVSGMNDITNGLHNLARNRMIAARNSTCELILRLPIVGALFWIFHASIEMVVIGYLVSSVVLFCIQKIDIQKLIPSNRPLQEKSINWRNGILKVALPASAWGFFVWIQQASDKWMLQMFSSTVDVAQYSVIYQVGYTPLVMLTGILVTFFAPILYRDNISNRALINKLLKFIAITTVLFMFLSWMFGDFILMSLVSEKFMQAEHYFPHMVLAAGLYSVGDILCIKMMSDIRIKEIMRIKIISSLIGFVANAVGAAAFGLAGIVYAAIFFGFCYATLFFVLYMDVGNNQESING